MKIKKTRQKIRRFMIFASLLLFPVTIFYLSPAIPLMAANEGIVAGSLFVFLGLFIVSLFSGRLFCGWICPAGALQEIASDSRTKRVNKKAWIIKFFIWIPWILLLAYIVLKAGGFRKADFFHNIEHVISIDSVPAYIVYYTVVILMLIPVFIAGRRGGCHTLCWIAPFMILGEKMGSLLTIPRVRIVSKNDSCTDCGLCTKACPMSIEVAAELKTGKLSENTNCILCGACIDVCPKIVPGFSFGRKK